VSQALSVTGTNAITTPEGPHQYSCHSHQCNALLRATTGTSQEAQARITHTHTHTCSHSYCLCCLQALQEALKYLKISSDEDSQMKAAQVRHDSRVVCIHTHTYTCMHKRTHMHAQTHTHTHTHKHTHTYFAQIQSQISTLEVFVSARAMIISQPQQALQMCEQLLMSIADDTQSGIRVGDVFALMVRGGIVCLVGLLRVLVLPCADVGLRGGLHTHG